MEELSAPWLDSVLESNAVFRGRIEPDRVPVERKPWPYAVITCMDPRVNLEAVGLPPFLSSGEVQSHARVIRTLGGFVEERSLAVGIHLAGFKELAIVMHSDCGCSLAYSRIDAIIENMKKSLGAHRFSEFTRTIREPFREGLLSWLKAFQDPREAVKGEAARVKSLPFVPESFIVHGLVYDLATGSVEVVVNGYDATHG